MIVTDIDELHTMLLADLWNNYIETTDMIITCIKDGNHRAALYYVAVMQTTLDVYFEAIDRIVEAIGHYED